MGSVVGQSAKVTGSIPGGAKVLGTDGICKHLPVSVSSYVEVCLCLLCSVCINSFTALWSTLALTCSCLPPMLIGVVMFGCIITGSLCSIVFVLSCVAACCKISVADCQLLK